MTVESSRIKAIYKGNGGATQFPVPFSYSKPDDIRLLYTDTNQRETSVTTNFRVQVGTSGETSIVYPVSGVPMPTGSKLTIYRNTPQTQIVDLVEGGRFDPEVLEKDGFDRAIMMIQEVQEGLDRAMKVSISDETPPKPAEEFYADMREFADAAQKSATESEVSSKHSAGAAEAASVSAQTARAHADEAWRAVDSIPGIEAAHMTINALHIEDGVLVWSQGRTGAVMRSSDYDWCSAPEHASMYYTLNDQGEVVRNIPVAPPAIGG